MGTTTPAKDPMPIQSATPVEPRAHLPGSAMQIDGDNVGATGAVDDEPPKSWAYITVEAVDKMVNIICSLGVSLGTNSRAGTGRFEEDIESREAGFSRMEKLCTPHTRHRQETEREFNGSPG